MIHQVRTYLEGIKTQWVKGTLFYHIIFWCSLLLVMMITNIPQKGFFDALASDFITICFYALITYINFFYLFPKYQKDKKFLLHFATLGIFALLLTPIKTVVLYLYYYDNSSLQHYYVYNQVYTFFSTLFVGIASTAYKIMTAWIIQQRDVKELESQTLQSELKFLKSQINPHFLFNTLNSLYALTLKKSDLAPEIVLKLAEMMRYMLYECNEKTVPLEKEINYIENYLELEKLRHGNKMDVSYHIGGHINKQMIAPLLLIPFIENTFKHGINSQVAKGFVDLQLQICDDDLLVTIENSKAHSIPRINGKRSGGIGLHNVKRRMQILYPEKHNLKITENPNSYKIELNINLS